MMRLLAHGMGRLIPIHRDVRAIQPGLPPLIPLSILNPSSLGVFRRHHLLHRFNHPPLLPGIRTTVRGTAAPAIYFSAPRGDALASSVTRLLYANVDRVATAIAAKPSHK